RHPGLGEHLLQPHAAGHLGGVPLLGAGLGEVIVVVRQVELDLDVAVPLAAGGPAVPGAQGRRAGRARRAAAPPGAATDRGHRVAAGAVAARRALLPRGLAVAGPAEPGPQAGRGAAGLPAGPRLLPARPARARVAPDAARAAAAGAAGVSCAARVAATAGAVASGAPVTASITGRGATPLAHCLCSSR